MWKWFQQLWIFLTCQKGDGFIQLSQTPQYPVVLKEDKDVDSMEDARRGVILIFKIGTIVQVNACLGIFKILSALALLAASRNINFQIRKLFRRRQNILISMAEQEYNMEQVDEELQRRMR
ncbi:unnamed protein product [Caenorhabditis brenneri]